MRSPSSKPTPKVITALLRLRRRSFRYLTYGLMWILFRGVAPARYALLYGKQDDEENLLVMTCALTASYDGRVIMLVTDAAVARERLRLVSRALGIDSDRAELLTRSPLRVRWLHARSEFVFTSHVVISAPRAHGPRVHIHLSHGTGPKRYRNQPSSETLVCSSTSLWNDAHLAEMRKPRSTKIIPGQARNDLLQAPVSVPDWHSRLGLSASRPLVIWAPTYRETLNYGIGTVVEGQPLGSVEGTAGLLLKHMLDSAERFKIELVVKPHVIEAAALSDIGCRVVTNAELWACGIAPSQFLGSAEGLITDYSSIVSDFLLTLGSIAFFCPDLATFDNSRGISGPSFGQLTKDLMLDRASAIDEYFRSISCGDVFRKDSRDAYMTSVGLDRSDGRTRQILDAVCREAQQFSDSQ